MSPSPAAAAVRPSWVPAAALYAAFLAAVYVAFGFQLVQDARALVEVDGYMRLERVLQLHATGQWWDSTLHDSNAPYGEVQHWTRPLDVLLLLGGWALEPAFGSFARALHWWGVVIAPLFHFALAFVGCWALTPVVRRMGHLVLALMAQPTLYGYLMPGRPDHHGLLLLAAILSLGVMIRASRGDQRGGLAVASGLGLGVGVWVAPEALLAAVLANLVFGLCWIFGDGPQHRFAARFGVIHAACMVLVIAVALPVEYPPSALLTIAYDKVSLAQLACALATLAVWLALAGLEARLRGPAVRLAGSVGVAIAAGAVLVSLFPNLAAGPLASVDPRLWGVWLSYVQEMRPLLSYQVQPGMLILLLGPLLVGTVGIVLSIRDQGVVRWARSGEGAVALFLLAYVALGFQQTRWTFYQGFAVAQPIAALLGRIEDRVDLWRAGNLARSLVRVLAILVVILGTDVLSLFVQARTTGLETRRMADYLASCQVSAIEPLLNDPTALGSAKQTILAPLNISPALVYRTDDRVIGTPYHRNVAGILDMNAVLRATDDATAREVLDRRQVDLLLLCRSLSDEPPGTLAHDLLAGGSRPWLVPVALPQAAAEAGFQVYRVQHQGPSSNSP